MLDKRLDRTVRQFQPKHLCPVETDPQRQKPFQLPLEGTADQTVNKARKNLNPVEQP